MHRVELKDMLRLKALAINSFVPNAPCGVESQIQGLLGPWSQIVPNAPCGVESIHQVSGGLQYLIVPNAPCGVESIYI